MPQGPAAWSFGTSTRVTTRLGGLPGLLRDSRGETVDAQSGLAPLHHRISCALDCARTKVRLEQAWQSRFPDNYQVPWWIDVQQANAG
jgi:hypothetical protein